MLRWRVLILVSMLVVRPMHGAPESAWERVLIEHAAMRPRLEPQDAYKLLVQGTLGSEHAAPNESAALTWLEKEAAALPDGAADEPLLEPIAPNGELVRVNLRPFRSRGGDLRALARAFAATGRKKFGTREELAEHWRTVERLAAERRLPFTSEKAADWGRRMREAGWPAVHHSSAFRDAYHPAYRVIARELLAEIGPAVH